jgi:hypothetical protein
MTKHTMTPLRQRMIDDMTMRNMSPSTIKIFVYACDRPGAGQRNINRSAAEARCAKAIERMTKSSPLHSARMQSKTAWSRPVRSASCGMISLS